MALWMDSLEVLETVVAALEEGYLVIHFVGFIQEFAAIGTEPLLGGGDLLLHQLTDIAFLFCGSGRKESSAGIFSGGGTGILDPLFGEFHCVLESFGSFPCVPPDPDDQRSSTEQTDIGGPFGDFGEDVTSIELIEDPRSQNYEQTDFRFPHSVFSTDRPDFVYPPESSCVQNRRNDR
jgi:hypothetical protein